MNYLFSSESVSCGHPDKICDQISDAILDAYLRQDPESKVAVECLITTGRLIIAGEVRSRGTVDAPEIARNILRQIGYTSESIGFDCHTAVIENLIHTQSPEIGKSVEHGGAGDQGLMFGYACRETPDCMPIAIWMANRIILALEEARNNHTIDWLLPDAKAQVTIRYQGDQPTELHTVVVSTQHKPGVSPEEIRETVTEKILKPVAGELLTSQTILHINPSGSFTVGGPHGDTGLTGRKIIVDTYGGKCAHGGGAFSGKDPSKVDRSAAYMARFLAKQVVLAGLSNECTVQLAYAIGIAEPVSVYVNTHDNREELAERISEFFRKELDLSPNGIIAKLDLKSPVYLATASGGHFGRQAFAWEQRDAELIGNLKNLFYGSEEK